MPPPASDDPAAAAAAADGSLNAPFFESVLTSLLHDGGLFTRGADTTFIGCVAPGAASKSTSISTLLTAQAAKHARLAAPEPTSPRGLTTLVGQLRKSLAHTAAAAAAAAAFQTAERERLERENTALTSQLRTQLAAEATWRD